MLATTAIPTRHELAPAAGSAEPIVSRLDCERLAPHLGEPATYARGRLRQLLERARVVEPPAVPGDVVTMRSRVVLRDPIDGTLDRFLLSYPGDTNVDEDEALLVTSPLGASLLAARPGDAITYAGARTQRTLVLQSIAFQPERAGRLDL